MIALQDCRYDVLGQSQFLFLSLSLSAFALLVLCNQTFIFVYGISDQCLFWFNDLDDPPLHIIHVLLPLLLYDFPYMYLCIFLLRLFFSIIVGFHPNSWCYPVLFLSDPVFLSVVCSPPSSGLFHSWLPPGFLSAHLVHLLLMSAKRLLTSVLRSLFLTHFWDFLPHFIDFLPLFSRLAFPFAFRTWGRSWSVNPLRSAITQPGGNTHVEVVAEFTVKIYQCRARLPLIWSRYWTHACHIQFENFLSNSFPSCRFIFYYFAWGH